MPALASQPAAVKIPRSPRVRFMLPEDSDYEVPYEPTEGPHERITKIVPLMTRKVNQFLLGLRPRERAQFDKVDVLQELWAVLLEKDHYYDPEKGIKYTTWTEKVIKQHLGEIWHRSHMVQGPRDVAQRLREPELQTAAMSIAIRQTMAEVSSLNLELYKEAQDPDDDDDGAVDQIASEKDLEGALARLSLDQCRVLGMKYGLRGQHEHTMAEIATRIGRNMTASAAGRAAQDAEQALLGLLGLS